MFGYQIIIESLMSLSSDYLNKNKNDHNLTQDQVNELYGLIK